MSGSTTRQFDPAVEKFHATFNKEFVIPKRTMQGQSLAVFADAIKSVPVDYVLAGGPSFARLRYPAMIQATFVLAAIENGGDVDLIKMMRIIGTDDGKDKNVKKLHATAERFFNRVKTLQNEWVMSRQANPAYH